MRSSGYPGRLNDERQRYRTADYARVADRASLSVTVITGPRADCGFNNGIEPLCKPGTLLHFSAKLFQVKQEREV